MYKEGIRFFQDMKNEAMDEELQETMCNGISDKVITLQAFLLMTSLHWKPLIIELEVRCNIWTFVASGSLYADLKGSQGATSSRLKVATGFFTFEQSYPVSAATPMEDQNHSAVRTKATTRGLNLGNHLGHHLRMMRTWSP